MMMRSSASSSRSLTTMIFHFLIPANPLALDVTLFPEREKSYHFAEKRSDCSTRRSSKKRNDEAVHIQVIHRMISFLLFSSSFTRLFALLLSLSSLSLFAIPSLQQSFLSCPPLTYTAPLLNLHLKMSTLSAQMRGTQLLLLPMWIPVLLPSLPFHSSAHFCSIS